MFSVTPGRADIWLHTKQERCGGDKPVNSGDHPDPTAIERQRIRAEYKRRELKIDPDLYAPWKPDVILAAASRRRVAATMLHDARVFPGTEHLCLEVGFGSLGWLGDLVAWGVPEKNLHGIELDGARLRKAQRVLPNADLRIGDAAELPWERDDFNLVIASTVFSSILDPTVRGLVASEICRVIKPGGALLWYDLAVNNPKNPCVRGVKAGELRRLFPLLVGRARSVTLAPPLARLIAPRSWVAAAFLECVPVLRTHIMAVLTKPDQSGKPPL